MDPDLRKWIPADWPDIRHETTDQKDMGDTADRAEHLERVPHTCHTPRCSAVSQGHSRALGLELVRPVVRAGQTGTLASLEGTHVPPHGGPRCPPLDCVTPVRHTRRRGRGRARCVPDRTVNRGDSRSLTDRRSRRRPASVPPSEPDPEPSKLVMRDPGAGAHRGHTTARPAKKHCELTRSQPQVRRSAGWIRQCQRHADTRPGLQADSQLVGEKHQTAAAVDDD
jgi:hypothetical protein